MTRLRRALLFMPGDDRRKIEKGIAAAPDSVIMDFEDGVALNRKAEARAVIAAALAELDFGPVEKVVRINPIGSKLEADDLAAVLPACPEAIMIPKVESAEQVDWVHRQTDLPLLLMIETAKGLINLKEIAAAPGETASAIARRHGVGLAALLDANDLTLRSIIRPGDVLRIPSR